MSVKQEFLKQWAFHVMMCLSLGTKYVVNQVEPAFARSLAACDEPLGGNYTGSAKCGDRLHVINEGMRISAYGQTQENAAMILAITGVSLLADTVGRRPAMLVGVFSVTASVVLFLVATVVPSASGFLFALGQGLQGLYPGEYISGLVFGDIAQMPSTDAAKFAQVQTMCAAISMPFWFIFGNAITIAELTEYRGVLLLLLSFNAITLFLCVAFMPETRPKAAQEKAPASVADALVMGVKSYKDLLVKRPAIPRFLLCHFVRHFEVTSLFLISLQVMAYHSWSQQDYLLSLLPLFIIVQIANASVTLLSDRIGILKTWAVGTVGHYIVGFPERLLIALNPKAWMLVAWFRAAFNFKDVYNGLVESQLYEAEDAAKVMNLQWLVGYFTAVLAFPFYTKTFDARSVTYYGKVFPNLIVIGIDTLKLVLLYVLLWSFDNGTSGYGPMMAENDKIQDEIKGLCDGAFSELTRGGPGPLTDEVVRTAGLVKLFGEYIDSKAREGRLEFQTKEDFFKAIRAFYSGKRLTEVRKVLKVARQMPDAVARWKEATPAAESEQQLLAAEKTGSEKKAD